MLLLVVPALQLVFLRKDAHNGDGGDGETSSAATTT
jgi:hypothetical protein